MQEVCKRKSVAQEESSRLHIYSKEAKMMMMKGKESNNHNPSHPTTAQGQVDNSCQTLNPHRGDTLQQYLAEPSTPLQLPTQNSSVSGSGNTRRQGSYDTFSLSGSVASRRSASTARASNGALGEGVKLSQGRGLGSNEQSGQSSIFDLSTASIMSQRHRCILNTVRDNKQDPKRKPRSGLPNLQPAHSSPPLIPTGTAFKPAGTAFKPAGAAFKSSIGAFKNASCQSQHSNLGSSGSNLSQSRAPALSFLRRAFSSGSFLHLPNPELLVHHQKFSRHNIVIPHSMSSATLASSMVMAGVKEATGLLTNNRGEAECDNGQAGSAHHLDISQPHVVGLESSTSVQPPPTSLTTASVSVTAALNRASSLNMCGSGGQLSYCSRRQSLCGSVRGEGRYSSSCSRLAAASFGRMHGHMLTADFVKQQQQQQQHGTEMHEVARSGTVHIIGTAGASIKVSQQQPGPCSTEDRGGRTPGEEEASNIAETEKRTSDALRENEAVIQRFVNAYLKVSRSQYAVSRLADAVDMDTKAVLSGDVVWASSHIVQDLIHDHAVLRTQQDKKKYKGKPAIIQRLNQGMEQFMKLAGQHIKGSPGSRSRTDDCTTTQNPNSTALKDEVTSKIHASVEIWTECQVPGGGVMVLKEGNTTTVPIALIRRDEGSGGSTLINATTAGLLPALQHMMKKLLLKGTARHRNAAAEYKTGE
ncbi:hypothetical protein CEUSTIGMA_g6698.t1 [Chlamydomonas eustigma]|uniref:Uncharacterized protein n=1 Tax=Chlamydomonas eustigma TaxID=1157962 RepID=A0A250X849_9CHLO|nr:hypothetical protein CEUSTIGMA_g6698.t1 [Chlamydomonas eustigma]|eukprot:GAX79258.1 hypothetical protein CEUSTIGMA_g6698.t1 [Chlamydomonas eustigma]